MPAQSRLLALSANTPASAPAPTAACSSPTAATRPSPSARPEAWLEKVESWGDGLVVDDLLNAEEEGDELLLMGLRLAEGIDLDRYQALSGRELDPARLAELLEHGMVERHGANLRATRAGFFVLDAVVADLAA